MSQPTLARPVALVLGLAVGVAACGGGGTTPATEAPTTTAASGPGAAPASTTASSGPVIQIAFRGGAVVGNARQQVRRGDTVRLVVTSDVADEVHVHGYDERADVAAGGTAEISFTANIPGGFEVELEQRHRRLLTLEVQG